jgi:hypothetical protein
MEVREKAQVFHAGAKPNGLRFDIVGLMWGKVVIWLVDAVCLALVIAVLTTVKGDLDPGQVIGVAACHIVFRLFPVVFRWFSSRSPKPLSSQTRLTEIAADYASKLSIVPPEVTVEFKDKGFLKMRRPWHSGKLYFPPDLLDLTEPVQVYCVARQLALKQYSESLRGKASDLLLVSLATILAFLAALAVPAFLAAPAYWIAILVSGKAIESSFREQEGYADLVALDLTQDPGSAIAFVQLPERPYSRKPSSLYPPVDDRIAAIKKHAEEKGYGLESPS